MKWRQVWEIMQNKKNNLLIFYTCPWTAASISLSFKLCFPQKFHNVMKADFLCSTKSSPNQYDLCIFTRKRKLFVTTFDFSIYNWLSIDYWLISISISNISGGKIQFGNWCERSGNQEDVERVLNRRYWRRWNMEKPQKIINATHRINTNISNKCETLDKRCRLFQIVFKTRANALPFNGRSVCLSNCLIFNFNWHTN